MADSRLRTKTTVESDLFLQRLDQDAVKTEVKISTSSDGTFMVVSTGELPPITLRQVRGARRNLKSFAELTGQPVRFEHNGRAIAVVQTAATGRARLSVHWWTLLRQLLGI